MDRYIHGFSDTEQSRLVRQASELAPRVFHGIDFRGDETVLEVGCAVGAELKLMLDRWPGLRLTGLDRSTPHLEAARAYLAGAVTEGRVTLVQGDACAMPFDDGAFDCVLTVWMLEHVPDPAAVIREARRVLKPGGRLILTEVDNSTFRFEPRNDVIAAWWSTYNRFQEAAGGDPCIGRKLAPIAQALGFQDVTAVEFPNISSRCDTAPGRRDEQLDYLEELLLSGAEQMQESGCVDAADRAALRAAFDDVRAAPETEFQYHAIRLTGRTPDSA